MAAVRSGTISLEEACNRYKLSIEEFLSWQRLIDSHGLAGLRVTRLQDYRGTDRDRYLPGTRWERGQRQRTASPAFRAREIARDRLTQRIISSPPPCRDTEVAVL